MGAVKKKREWRKRGSWWRGCRRSGSGGSGGVGGGDAEEGVEEGGELVVKERGAIYGDKNTMYLERRWLLCMSPKL